MTGKFFAKGGAMSWTAIYEDGVVASRKELDTLRRIYREARKGWVELGRQVARLERMVEREAGKLGNVVKVSPPRAG